VTPSHPFRDVEWFEAKGVGIIRTSEQGSFHHAVAFYESDAILAEEVVRFLDPTNPGVAIVVATEAHREAIQDRLDRVADLSRIGCRYISLDAESLLPEFMVDNFPDEDLFRSMIGRMFDPLEPGPVRVFGEMVALLWERGDVPSALKLEKLWNRLAEDYTFELFCAYPTSTFEGSAGLEAYLRMCGTHSHLVPFKG
jgi:hypothetical protein